MVSIFVCSRVIDGILYGRDSGKMMMVFTSRYDELADAIHTQLDRGCTLLPAQGAYTRQDRPVLICAVRKAQYHELKMLAYTIDPYAFVVALDAKDYIVIGAVLCVLFVSCWLKSRHGSVRELMYKFPAGLRYAAYILMFLSIVIFGAYGIGYDSNQFIYNQF